MSMHAEVGSGYMLTRSTVQRYRVGTGRRRAGLRQADPAHDPQRAARRQIADGELSIDLACGERLTEVSDRVEVSIEVHERLGQVRLGGTLYAAPVHVMKHFAADSLASRQAE